MPLPRDDNCRGNPGSLEISCKVRDADSTHRSIISEPTGYPIYRGRFLLKKARAVYRVRVYIKSNRLRSRASFLSRDVRRSGMRVLQDEPSETRGSFAAPSAFYALVSLRGETDASPCKNGEKRTGRRNTRRNELIFFAETFLALLPLRSPHRTGICILSSRVP